MFHSLLASYRYRWPDLVPAASWQIAEVEHQLGIKLPEFIRDFFLITGNDYVRLFEGVGAERLSRATENQLRAQKLLNEQGVELNSPFFAFSSYSDQFLFSYLKEGEDPAVYRFETELAVCGDEYIPGSSAWGLPKGVTKLADRFSGLIEEIVNARIKKP